MGTAAEDRGATPPGAQREPFLFCRAYIDRKLFLKIDRRTNKRRRFSRFWFPLVAR